MSTTYKGSQHLLRAFVCQTKTRCTVKQLLLARSRVDFGETKWLQNELQNGLQNRLQNGCKTSCKTVAKRLQNGCCDSLFSASQCAPTRLQKRQYIGSNTSVKKNSPVAIIAVFYSPNLVRSFNDCSVLQRCPINDRSENTMSSRCRSPKHCGQPATAQQEADAAKADHIG